MPPAASAVVGFTAESDRRTREGTIVSWRALGRALAVCVIAVPLSTVAAVPAQAKNGDTHITGQGIIQTLDCNESTLIVVGTGNTINAFGTCWAITVQGSSNIIVADTVINDITVYGSDQTVLFHNGDPTLWDRGRELGMTNRLDRVPA
jgi:Protein of unknown function (DUF3060)